MTIGKRSILPTDHYTQFHSDVSWDLVVRTIISPTKVHPNKRLGKDRFTYIKYFKEKVIEIHVKRDMLEDIIWVINAFRMERK